jgi:hypothetical protein
MHLGVFSLASIRTRDFYAAGSASVDQNGGGKENGTQHTTQHEARSRVALRTRTGGHGHRAAAWRPGRVLRELRPIVPHPHPPWQGIRGSHGMRNCCHRQSSSLGIRQEADSEASAVGYALGECGRMRPSGGVRSGGASRAFCSGQHQDSVRLALCVLKTTLRSNLVTFGPGRKRIAQLLRLAMPPVGADECVRAAV